MTKKTRGLSYYTDKLWSWLFFLSIPALIYVASRDQEIAGYLGTALSAALRLLTYVFVLVGQMFFLFYYLARTKTIKILPGDAKTLTLADYKGQPNLVKLMNQWVSLLADPQKFREMGGKLPNGIILAGAPGTGKTYMARAIAGEAGIPFIALDGSSFSSMFVGVPILKIMAFIREGRELAQKYGACIAYIDEFDTIAMNRGAVQESVVDKIVMGAGMGAMGVLPRLLTTLDGVDDPTFGERWVGRLYKLFGKTPPPRKWHVFWLASTNRPDILDPAVTRPGRFGKVVHVSLPDKSGRREIINYYLSKIDHGPVDVESLVSDTAWATPVHLMSAITVDAVRYAVFDGRTLVTQRDIEQALQEQALGLENPIEELDDKQRYQIAVHEAGHAVAIYRLKQDKRMISASITRRSGSLGRVMSVNEIDMYTMPLTDLVDDIKVSMAGHIATNLVLGQDWTGAGGDFEKARDRIQALLLHGYFGPPVSEDLFETYRDEVKAFWERLLEETRWLMAANKADIERIAAMLVIYNDLTGQQIIDIMAGDFTQWSPTVRMFLEA